MANGYIGQVHIDQVDYKIGSTLFAVLDTGSSIGTIVTNNGTTTFNVPLDGFVLTDGVTIHIQFKQSWINSANSTTFMLKVGNTAAAQIENPNGAIIWYANSVISFTYDGEKYIMNTVGFDASDITIDISQLSNLTLGNIQSTGILQTNDVTISVGDKLVITDASDNNKIARASLAFTSPIATQTQATTFLRSDGTWAMPSYTTNTDTKVTQAYSTTNNSYPLLLSATAGIASVDSRGDTTAIVNNAIYANPSDGTLHAAYFAGDGSNLTNIIASSVDWNNIQNIPSTLVTSVNGKTGPSVTITLGDLGLSAALRFVGVTTSNITDGWTGIPAGITNYTTPEIGDVVIKGGEEFVCISISGTTYTWELLGRDSSFALDTEVIKKSDFVSAYQLIYSSNIGTPAYLNPNTSSTIKYLSMQGDGTNGDVPAWVEINKTTLGLSNVTDHQQVHEVSWDSNNKKITRSKNGTASDVVTFASSENITLSATASTLTISATQFRGATASANGAAGYLPGPTMGSEGKFLQGSGNWMTLSIPQIASVANGILTITNVALSVS